MSVAPLVSVIVPVYNAAPFIAETIDGLLAQTYTTLEIIVVDDGSCDGTPAVLERYRGYERIRLLRHENRGESATVLRGMEEARGEIVAIVNADDPPAPGLVARSIEVLQGDPHLGAVYPDWWRIDRDGAVLDVVRTHPFDIALMLTSHLCIPGVGALVRRSALGDEPVRDAAAGACADFDFWLRFGLRNQARRISEPLASWRFHAAGTSQASAGAAFAAEKIAMIERFFARADLPPEIRRLQNQALSAAYFKAAMVGMRARGVPTRRYLARSFALRPFWPTATPRSERRSPSHIAYLLALPVSRWVLRWLVSVLPRQQRGKAESLLNP